MSKADIDVNGKRYSVACAPGQEGRLAELGEKLDMRVKHIAHAVGDIGDARLLLVAALALLDEAEGAAVGASHAGDGSEARAAAALADAAARIDAIASRLDAVSTKTS